jgi:hypothetical protein
MDSKDVAKIFTGLTNKFGIVKQNNELCITMENYKHKLIGALHILRTALSTYDTELSHNILIMGGTDETEEEQEQNLENYIQVLDKLIKETWKLENK